MLTLAKLLDDGCIVQANRSLTVWGWSKPETVVNVVLGNSQGTAISDASGAWQIEGLGPLDYGGPYSLTVSAGSERICHTCYAGEVVVCAGQSNMELPMQWVRPYYAQEFAREPDPLLRQYKVIADYDFAGPVPDHANAQWQTCDEQGLPDFSAVGYFFGRMLRAMLGVPVGLLNVSLGGSPIESWMDAQTLQQFPHALHELRPYVRAGAANARKYASLHAIDRWKQSMYAQELPSDELQWRAITLPSSFDAYGLANFQGLLELRKTVVLPSYEDGKSAMLYLGTWADSDETFVNGARVGSQPSKYELRDYAIPGGILHAGANEIRVRLTCNAGHAYVTEGKDMRLQIGDANYDVSGTWQLAVVSRMNEPCPAEDFVRWKPTGLYNAMVSPCLRYPVRAVLWYQGESNTGDHANMYADLLTHMIALWRRGWQDPSLPFLIVQLPNYANDGIEDGGWPLVRAAQWEVAQQVPHTATVVTLDAGEYNDLHPYNKQLVALRLFDAARMMLYGENSTQPQVIRVEEYDSALHITYGIRGESTTQPCSVLTLDGNDPGEFAFVWHDAHTVSPANAVIQDGTVIIALPERRPDQLRYAWSNNPHRGIIVDTQGTPVPPWTYDLVCDDAGECTAASIYGD